MHPVRPYLYYDFTISLCEVCLRRVDAKVVFEDNYVYMLKRCPEHGHRRVRIASDVDYYKRCREYIKPGEVPRKFSTATHWGCPYDCGLCSDHEQHSCLTLIEVTDRCNLKCPTCYASSGPHVGRHRTLDEIQKMLDTLVEHEGDPDVVQISGGEPTVHPEFFAILDEAKKRPIRHLMLNTNGIRIARDPDFAKQLADYMPGFEVYLQFDSFRPHVLEHLRGEDLTLVRQQALDNLDAAGVSTTLVVTLERGWNDDEIGDIIKFGLSRSCVRGVTFQPTQTAGRLDTYSEETGRLTLTDVRTAIIEQSSLFTGDDLVPVPCNPDALCMAYALKYDGDVFPLTRLFSPSDLLEGTRNTIVFEEEDVVRERAFRLFSTGTASDDTPEALDALLCCLPKINAPALRYDNLFRVIIMQFLDPAIFDVRSVKRSCVHIVHPDGRIIPFDTMNIFYRDGLQERTDQLRSEIRPTR